MYVQLIHLQKRVYPESMDAKSLKAAISRCREMTEELESWLHKSELEGSNENQGSSNRDTN